MGLCFTTSQTRPLYKSRSSSLQLSVAWNILPCAASAPYLAPSMASVPYLAPCSASPPRRMMSLQRQLPRLPVPPLQQTLRRFLEVVQPLYNEEDYNHAKDLVNEFGSSGGIGEVLQALLEKRAAKSVNWLEDWWQQYAYFDYRLPVPIHVNPGIMVPPFAINGQQEQIQLAAKLVAGIMDYKIMIDDQSLPVEHMGKDPLCMVQFFRILSSCRIPGIKTDTIVNFPPDQTNPPKHIVVVHNNHYYSLEAYSYSGQPLTEQQIYEQLCEIVSRTATPAEPIGLLTADNRNSWGKLYNRLIKDPQNRASAMSIQRCIFMLCLDKPIPHAHHDDRDTIIANQMNHGGGTKHNSSNRWFDKTLQFIVGSDGAFGVNYEHSTAEGPPIISIVDHAMSYLKNDHPVLPPVEGVRPPLYLPFNISPEIQDGIDEAKRSFDVSIKDLDLISYKFEKFGKDFIKSQKMSPDAFIQVAFQLSYFKMYGRHAPTYESGSLRRFQHGRTETIRSCTQASSYYCNAMLDADVDVAKKAHLLREAIAAHKQYTNYAINGQGVDRHLLGLKMTAISNGMDVPALFMDPIYSEACSFRMSTSQVASQHDAVLCFGPVVPDGYGLCYNPMIHHLNFAISSWRSCPETDAATFANHLKTSLEDAQNILMQTAAKL